MKSPSLRSIITLALLALLAAVPAYSAWLGNTYYLTLFGRIVILAIAAVSLNLILGYGGMVSFGHALYLGVGAYAVGISAFHGIDNGWFQLAAALAASAAIGAVTGAIALRTRGIAFIMITLAFAQMGYFLVVSLRPYGGDDGLPVAAATRFGPLDLGDALALYYTALAVLGIALVLLQRLVRSRFGVVLRATQANWRRTRALGFSVFAIPWVAYILSAMLCGVAGLLFANLTGFCSPSYMAWSMSGELIIMVVLGGMATVGGPVAGAIALILLEEGLKMVAGDHWAIILGPLIVLIVIFTRHGIFGFLPEKRMHTELPALGVPKTARR